MVKPTLLVLAAGMGSRYGSLKQMDGVGPNGEAIIDYSIYDAIRAGFGKVVFVIRHAFEADFREVFTPERFGGQIEIDFVFQELDKLPAGFSAPAERVKPWGTNHAVMMGAEVIKKEPFAVINADDFYGYEAYKTMGKYLCSLTGQKNHYAMVGYELKNTLSEHGSVARGICTVDSKGNLKGMVERTHIEKQGKQVVFKDDKGVFRLLDEASPVSMNFFGFTPDYFEHSERYFSNYLKDNIENPQAEFFIPIMVNRLVSEGVAEMRVLHSSAQWFGVTYKEDRPMVVERIGKLIEAGVYPEKLWNNG